MKTLFFPMALFVLTSAVMADVPKKIPRTRYSSLWTNSPFTSKPPPPEGAVVENAINDLTLLGVSSLGGNKYRVTVVNKKTPEAERIYIDSDSPRGPDNYKIVRVLRTPGDPLGTTVTLSSGSMSGTISYDEKLLTIAAPKPPPNPNVPPGQNGLPPGQLPNANNPNRPGGLPNPGQLPPGARPPRPRVIPPPTPQAGGSAANPPMVNGSAVVQPNATLQPAGQSSATTQRPTRRRNY